MTKEEHNSFLYQIVAIQRHRDKGDNKIAEEKTLRVLANLVTEIYDMQH